MFSIDINLDDLEDKLSVIYEKHIFNIPENIDEVIGSKSFRTYEIFNEYEEVREIITNIELLLEENKSFTNELCILLGKRLVESLMHSNDFVKNTLHSNNLSDDNMEKMIRDLDLVTASNLEKLFKNITPNSIKNIITWVDNKNLESLYSEFLELDLDLKEYYDSFLLAIYRTTNLQSFVYLSEENLYLVAILDDLLNLYEYKNFIFNGFNKSENQINQQIYYLIELYKKNNHELKDEIQFDKYKLIEITQERNLLDNTPMIIDSKFNISMSIKYIDPHVYIVLTNLLKENNFSISLYPDIGGLYNFLNTFQPVFESKDFGKSPTLDDLKNKAPNIGIKFIDFESKNTFWVRQNGEDLTFEELCDDFNTLGENVITKVLHLQHFTEDDILYIKHIDLEYIFYTLDEYAKRQDGSFVQKGNSIKRQKIFKIDNAKIPLHDYLYPLAYYSFDHKELVKECFQEMKIIPE